MLGDGERASMAEVGRETVLCAESEGLGDCPVLPLLGVPSSDTPLMGNLACHSASFFAYTSPYRLACEVLGLADSSRDVSVQQAIVETG